MVYCAKRVLLQPDSTEYPKFTRALAAATEPAYLRCGRRIKNPNRRLSTIHHVKPTFVRAWYHLCDVRKCIRPVDRSDTQLRPENPTFSALLRQNSGWCRSPQESR